MRSQVFNVSIALLVAAILLAGTASSARAANEVIFLGARFIAGKGLALTFKVSAEYDLTQLANVAISGELINLICTTKGENGGFKKVVCIANVSQRSMSGSALISFGAYSFSTKLNEARPWCYSVFDFDLYLDWSQIGSHCQAHTVGEGDVIPFYSPIYGDSFDYIYGDYTIFDPLCGPNPPDLGKGFYYECF
ncbi:MAG: hypothetical protein WD740_04915 [Anaerolineales bacterium]